MPRLLVRALAVASLLAPAGSPARAAQASPPRPPVSYGDRVAIGGDIGRYALLYGTPEFRGLDDENARPWPERSAIRTVGRLEEIPGRRRSGDTSSALPGGGGDYDDVSAFLRVCAEWHCLALVPVPEMRDAFAGAVLAWVHQGVEVVGAIDQLPSSGGDPTQGRSRVFLVWSVFESPFGSVRRNGAGGSSLEALVRYPKGVEKREVTVSGTFRGANLFADLPAESRHDAGDWVLRDGPFSIWVTGKTPRGRGFALDPQSRSDCSWRLEVKGTVETVGGYVYFHAKSVAPVRRERGDGPAP
jgi:hypothetical protein